MDTRKPCPMVINVNQKIWKVACLIISYAVYFINLFVVNYLEHIFYLFKTSLSNLYTARTLNKNSSC